MKVNIPVITYFYQTVTTVFLCYNQPKLHSDTFAFFVDDNGTEKIL